jgi:hypothetical protein
VDANLVDDKWLLVVTAEDVRKFDVRLLHDSTPQSLAEGETRIHDSQPRELSVVGEWHDSAQTERELPALAG